MFAKPKSHHDTHESDGRYLPSATDSLHSPDHGGFAMIVDWDWPSAAAGENAANGDKEVGAFLSRPQKDQG